MIARIDPRILLLVGFVLLILGIALPILMIMQILESTLFLNFVTYIAQFLGVVLGTIGAVFLVSRNRNRNK